MKKMVKMVSKKTSDDEDENSSIDVDNDLFDGLSATSPEE